MEEFNNISPAQIDAVLSYLPVFQRPEFEFGTLSPGGSYWEYSDPALRFIQALHDHGFILQFDWMAWAEQVGCFRPKPSIESADLLTLCRLLTAHVRCDRLNEGHLLRTFESGELLAILNRLQGLRGLMAS